LKNKGRFGMDSRTVWFVANSQSEHDAKKAEYPGVPEERILLCDRTNIQDTLQEQPINRTTKLHEVRSVATVVPDTETVPFTKKGKQHTAIIRKWPVMTSKLPCNCIHCKVNPVNNQCKYQPWRSTKPEVMKAVVEIVQ